MNKPDRERLTSALRDHVAKIAADLRTKLLAPGPARVRAEKLRDDERVGEAYEVWTDLLSRRAAVLWVLKSVYVRVLEDRGLLSPGRLLDPEAQQLFERLAPHLGETTFLRWVYRDLANPQGGLPELFSVQPAEVVLPSDELSRGLIAFWRHRDADTGAVWNFAEEKFEGELMGDLYQELDPVVKDRFALCQTPDFVRGFILDRTLTPAIETFGADQVRLLDPACGSGHFLIDGLKRLVVATAAQHRDWARARAVQQALARVVGMDLNDYACGLARARLIMTAAELAGVTTLADAGAFHPHVYWADGLEQVERDEVRAPVQVGLFAPSVDERPRATFTRSDVRTALRKLFASRFHAVVANPPYITEKDAARKEYHREKVGKAQRYVSAYREYSLGSPFVERCFQLAEPEGFVGIITSNNFMKREFGKPLVEKVLAGVDLTLVADTSQAYIPNHGTPTVLMFGRNRRPVGSTVRAVMGKRGERGTPDDPARGEVWSSIILGWSKAGFETEYASVADVPRATFAKHPWSLGGGGAAELKAAIEGRQHEPLGALGEIGVVCMTRADDVYVGARSTFGRLGISPAHLRSFPLGNSVREWAVAGSAETAIFPYDDQLQPARETPSSSLHGFLWRYRTQLWERREPNGNHRALGLTWFEWSRLIRRRLKSPLSIAFAKVATHNHFVLDRGEHLFSDGSPVVKLASTAEDDHLAVLGLLNSSTACFWMKQVFHNKGGGTDSGKMQSDPAKVAFEFTATGLEKFPIPELSPAVRDRLIALARACHELAATRSGLLVAALPDAPAFAHATSASAAAAVDEARQREQHLLERQVVVQEELDWLCYRAWGLSPDSDALLLPDEVVATASVPIGARPFELAQARGGRAVGVDGQALHATLPSSAPPALQRVWEARTREIDQNASIRLVEHEHYKRRWLITPKHLAGRVETFDDRVRARVETLVADVVEEVASARPGPYNVARLTAALLTDRRFAVLARLRSGRADYDPDAVVAEVLQHEAVPSHPFHRYSALGLAKFAAWESTWEEQRKEDAGLPANPEVPPSYAQPDFVSRRVFELRGKLDVPKERFIAFTEVPGHAGTETLYGWAGWTPLQRLKALLAIDENLDDAGVPLADRIGVLDSAWRLLPDVAREDAAAATRLRAELQALVGPTGPSRELLDEWKQSFAPQNLRASRTRPTARVADEEAS